jgi:hypothetical protein
MRRITEAEARQLWQAAMREHGWENRKIAEVMFNWDPPEKPTVYHDTPPVWRRILADEHNEADRDAYLQAQTELIRWGTIFSQRRSGGAPVAQPEYQPLAIAADVIIESIRSSMNSLHPMAALHEQVMRAKFVTKLPQIHAEVIGSLNSAVHPERATPSGDYRRIGEREMHARYDLGFGHPIEDDGIVGVIELKAAGSFDHQLDSGLQHDFTKLLDPRLPPSALRVSWMIARRRARIDPVALLHRAENLLEPVETSRGLTGRVSHLDTATGWLGWRWENNEARVLLAWYQPSEDDPAQFEPSWGPTAPTGEP